MAGTPKKKLVPKTEDINTKLKRRKRRPKTEVTLDHPKHGRVSIRHMTESIMYGDSVLLLGDVAVDDERRIWIQIAKAGSFKGHSAGPFEMTSKTFEEIIANFKAHPEHIPIDFEHASESDATSGTIPTHGAPAQGWIIDMKVEGGSLYGLVEWGSLARDYIKNGQYKYFSPAIRFGAKDRVSGRPIGARMTSGALTNSPFLSGMQTVAAKDTDDDLDELEFEDEPSASAEETSEEDQNMDLAKDLKDTQDRLAVMSDKHKVEETKAAEFSLKLKDETARAEKAEAALKTLTDWKAEREAKDIEERVALAFDTYKDTRKLSDADKEAMVIVLTNKPETFEKQYPKVPPAQQHLLRNVTSQRETPTVHASTPGLPEGFSLSDPAVVVKLADHLVIEKRVDKTTALIMADKQVRAARNGSR